MKLKKGDYCITGGTGPDSYQTIDIVTNITKKYITFKALLELDGKKVYINEMNVPNNQLNDYINRKLTRLEIMMLDFEDRI